MAIFERSSLPTGDAPLPSAGEEDIDIEIEGEQDPIADALLAEAEKVISEEHNRNLAYDLDEAFLDDLGAQVVSETDADERSRASWKTLLVKGLKLLGFTSVDDPEREPLFKDASNVVHPLLAEAVVKFQSRAISELFPAGGPAKVKIVGKRTEAKERQAVRVKEYINYQLTEEMDEYFEEMDRMLFHLPLAGMTLKKVYYDEIEQEVSSRFVKAEDFVVSNDVVGLKEASRFAHIITLSPNDFKRYQSTGFYMDLDDLAPQRKEPDELDSVVNKIQGQDENEAEEPEEYIIIESYRNVSLPGFDDDADFDRPYIVSVDKASGKVLSIRRNWRADDPLYKKRIYFVPYRYVPGLGFYAFGLIHLIGGLCSAATGALDSLLDAAGFSNLPAGWKARGVKVDGANEPFTFGEWRDVDAPSGNIRDAFVPLPYKEPSGTLFELLKFLVDAGQKFADSTEQVIADSTNYGPVGTTVALLEASAKMFTAIHKRLHQAQGRELKLIAELNGEYMPAEYPYEVENGDKKIFAKDFNGEVDVIPVSDPNISSSAQRIVMAQVQLQEAKQAPQIHDLKEAYKRFYDALGVRDIDRLMPDKTKARPLDPVGEVSAILTGKPVAAFPEQDNMAHVEALRAFMADPQYGGDETIDAAVSANLRALIAEHIALAYKKEIELALGQPLPPEIPPELESQISRAVAAVATKLSEEHDRRQNQLAQAAMLEAQLRKYEVDSRERIAMAKLAADMQETKETLDLKEEQMKLDVVEAEKDRKIEREKIRRK